MPRIAGSTKAVGGAGAGAAVLNARVGGLSGGTTRRIDVMRCGGTREMRSMMDENAAERPDLRDGAGLDTTNIEYMCCRDVPGA